MLGVLDLLLVRPDRDVASPEEFEASVAVEIGGGSRIAAKTRIAKDQAELARGVWFFHSRIAVTTIHRYTDPYSSR